MTGASVEFACVPFMGALLASSPFMSFTAFCTRITAAIANATTISQKVMQNAATILHLLLRLFLFVLAGRTLSLVAWLISDLLSSQDADVDGSGAGGGGGTR